MCAKFAPQRLQGCLAHKTHPPLQDRTAARCLRTYGDFRGVGVSYERGTPVALFYFRPRGALVNSGVAEPLSREGEEDARAHRRRLVRPAEVEDSARTVLDLRTNTSQNCEAVPSRARV